MNLAMPVWVAASAVAGCLLLGFVVGVVFAKVAEARGRRKPVGQPARLPRMNVDHTMAVRAVDPQRHRAS